MNYDKRINSVVLNVSKSVINENKSIDRSKFSSKSELSSLISKWYIIDYFKK